MIICEKSAKIATLLPSTFTQIHARTSLAWIDWSLLASVFIQTAVICRPAPVWDWLQSELSVATNRFFVVARRSAILWVIKFMIQALAFLQPQNHWFSSNYFGSLLWTAELKYMKSWIIPLLPNHIAHRYKKTQVIDSLTVGAVSLCVWGHYSCLYRIFVSWLFVKYKFIYLLNADVLFFFKSQSYSKCLLMIYSHIQNHYWCAIKIWFTLSIASICCVRQSVANLSDYYLMLDKCIRTCLQGDICLLC